MNKITRSAIVNYSARQMYDLVADIPAYSEFLPWCASARYLRLDDGEVDAAIDMAYKGVRKTFATRNTLAPGKSVEMRLLSGPFSHLHGCWRFTDLDGAACEVELELEFGFSNRVAEAVVGPVFVHIANTLMDAFLKRADSTWGSADAG